jgi:hypothetical protein
MTSPSATPPAAALSTYRPALNSAHERNTGAGTTAIAHAPARIKRRIERPVNNATVSASNRCTVRSCCCACESVYTYVINPISKRPIVKINTDRARPVIPIVAPRAPARITINKNGVRQPVTVAMSARTLTYDHVTAIIPLTASRPRRDAILLTLFRGDNICERLMCIAPGLSSHPKTFETRYSLTQSKPLSMCRSQW